MRSNPGRVCLLTGLALAGAVAGCQVDAPSDGSPASDRARAEQVIRAGELLDDIRTLASDEFEGRAPATPGEDRTIEWLAAAFERAGAQPGNPDGGWLQEVPLTSIRSTPYARFRVGDQQMVPVVLEEFVAVTRQDLPRVEIGGSEIVFAGYGVDAPEYGWNDFEGLDVRGKTLLVLVGDPPVPSAHDPGRLDPAAFRGPAMTYYGRWTYKYEVAARLGAAACVIVHQTGAAGYPWEVVAEGRRSETFDAGAGVGGEPRLPVEAWVTEDTARRLLKACGEDFDELARRALSRDFRPVPLAARADFRIDVERSEALSHNVVARIPGSGPRADEWIVYSAHWDHLGVDPAREGDGIFNGAIDNATGTAALVALARAFSALPQPPQRSILLIALTAEEKGLLGARHYASAPLYPLERTLAVINMDALNPWGRTRDVVSVGLGLTTLDPLLAAEASRQGRTVRSDPEPHKGFFFRSDHFEFAKRGVPVLYAESGVDYIGRPNGWGLERKAAYTAEDYHKPSDEVRSDWDLSGLVEDTRLFFRVGLRIAEQPRWPEWVEGSEFRGVREAALLDAERSRAGI
jgi:Zn-dependent M28 family amino/carboxypeptidase